MLFCFHKISRSFSLFGAQEAKKLGSLCISHVGGWLGRMPLLIPTPPRADECMKWPDNDDGSSSSFFIFWGETVVVSRPLVVVVVFRSRYRAGKKLEVGERKDGRTVRPFAWLPSKVV